MHPSKRPTRSSHPGTTPRLTQLSSELQHRGGLAFYAISTKYLIVMAAWIIMDVEATPAHHTPEFDSTRTMVDRVEERFGVKPQRLVGDTAYGIAPLLGWMVEGKQIAPHVPVCDKTARKDGSLSIGEFQWECERNAYLNHRFVHLPTIIGVMAIALVLLALDALGLDHGLRQYEESFLRAIDFPDVLMHGMLSFLLFAGALHVDLRALRKYRWQVAALAWSECWHRRWW